MYDSVRYVVYDSACSHSSGMVGVCAYQLGGGGANPV